MKTLSKLFALALGCVLLMGNSVCAFAAEAGDTHTIRLSSEAADGAYTHSAVLDGEKVAEYDYTWHVDPGEAHDAVKNSPAEYYTGTEPSGEDAVYIAHDIFYYPELDESKFQQIRYDGETEWAYFYEAEGYENYIFATLPVQKTGFPSEMMHTASEAYDNAVLHITQPGTYVLEGQWHGQIRVDLGAEDDVFSDASQSVTLILGGRDVECTVAPGVVFASVYECDNAWEEKESYGCNVDTAQAGANVVIADGTTNNITGTNIYRILKTQYKTEASSETYPTQKKRLKVDGAFYSYQSMNITGGELGTGTLNIVSGFEGLDSELHLTINGGNINIYAENDGINVNEDGVSVVTINGGNLHICAGLGAEGDGIDSNGFLVINGGTVISAANPASDSGLDSDCGSFIHGGTVVALGSTMDWAEADDTADTTQPVLNLRFAGTQNADEAIVIADMDGNVVFAYDPDKDEAARSGQRTYRGAIISSPNLCVGNSYQIYLDGDVTGEEAAGVYDISTVTDYTGGSLQCYSGSAMDAMGGGRITGDAPSRPEKTQGDTDWAPPDQASGATPPEIAEDGMAFAGGGGMTPPEGAGHFGPGDRGQMQDGFADMQTISGATCTYETGFTLTDKVNAFTSVTDYRHALVKVEGNESANGEDGSEYYICSGCGHLFADEAGLVPLTGDQSAQSGQGNTLLTIGVFVLAAAFLAACVVGIILIVRHKPGRK